MSKSLMSECLITKVIYVAKTEELYIKFSKNIVPGYDCACFVNVPFGTAKRFSDSKDRDAFFDQEIRTKYRYYCTHIAFGEVQVPPEEFKSEQDWKEAKAGWEASAGVPDIDTTVTL